ncbi:MAG: hypothetical protein JWO17_957 [Actinomycetia bacterium]|nr:hypothetical protein [Actinomycetes bacterium]
MQTWTFRAAVLGVLSAAALIVAGVGMPAGTAPVSHAARDGFAGPLGAQAVARPIARDLTPVSRVTLHRVPCADAGAARSCFAAGR